MGQDDKQWAQRILDECYNDDPETDHEKADALIIKLLNELGMPATAIAYEQVEKWYA